jgi:hypothetical protein
MEGMRFYLGIACNSNMEMFTIGISNPQRPSFLRRLGDRLPLQLTQRLPSVDRSFFGFYPSEWRRGVLSSSRYGVTKEVPNSL